MSESPSPADWTRDIRLLSVASSDRRSGRNPKQLSVEMVPIMSKKRFGLTIDPIVVISMLVFSATTHAGIPNLWSISYE